MSDQTAAELLEKIKESVENATLGGPQFAISDPTGLLRNIENAFNYAREKGLAACPELTPVFKVMATIPPEKITNDTEIAYKLMPLFNKNPFQALLDGDDLSKIEYGQFGANRKRRKGPTAD